MTAINSKNEKINELLKKNFGKSATGQRIIGSVTIEENEDFNFVMFDSTCDGDSEGLKRYNFAVFSYLFLECYYQTSNVIDKDKGYTMQEFKQMFNSYLTSLHTSLQKYL